MKSKDTPQPCFICGSRAKFFCTKLGEKLYQCSEENGACNAHDAYLPLEEWNQHQKIDNESFCNYHPRPQCCGRISKGHVHNMISDIEYTLRKVDKTLFPKTTQMLQEAIPLLKKEADIIFLQQREK